MTKKRTKHTSTKTESVKKSKLPWILLCIVLAIVGLFCYFVYQEYRQVQAAKELELALLQVGIEEITMTSMLMGFQIGVHNPNDIDVNVGEFNAVVLVSDQVLTTVELPGTYIPADGMTSVHFTARVGYFDAGIALINAVKNKEANWQIRGQYILQLPFGIRVPYSFEIP